MHYTEYSPFYPFYVTQQLHKIKEVEANPNSNYEINNCKCGTLAYVGIILTVSSMIIVIFPTL